jgi:hypothetical protein
MMMPGYPHSLLGRTCSAASVIGRSNTALGQVTHGAHMLRFVEEPDALLESSVNGGGPLLDVGDTNHALLSAGYPPGLDARAFDEDD